MLKFTYHNSQLLLNFSGKRGRAGIELLVGGYGPRRYLPESVPGLGHCKSLPNTNYGSDPECNRPSEPTSLDRITLSSVRSSNITSTSFPFPLLLLHPTSSYTTLSFLAMASVARCMRVARPSALSALRQTTVVRPVSRFNAARAFSATAISMINPSTAEAGSRTPDHHHHHHHHHHHPLRFSPPLENPRTPRTSRE